MGNNFPGATNDAQGFIHHEVLDASGADATPEFTNCRAIYFDTGGIAKLDYGNNKTIVRTFPAGRTMLRNVTKLHRYYVATTAGTAKCWTDAGAEITNAVCLFY